MSWREELEGELQRGKRAEAEGNAGKARTCARRAVGIVVTEFQKQTGEEYGNDFLRQLRGIAGDATLPTLVREAAERLQSRLSRDFQSLSVHPLEDARVIIEHFVRYLPL